jgi:hypothetical protein
MPAVESAAIGPVTFFARQKGLTISPDSNVENRRFSAMKGELVTMADGTKARVGEKIIEFQPMGQDRYGRYTTSDQQVIDYLEWRRANIGDIMTAEEYAKEVTPKEIQISDLQRKLDQANSLLAELQKQGKELPRK